jgi:hypothetical protein
MNVCFIPQVCIRFFLDRFSPSSTSSLGIACYTFWPLVEWVKYIQYCTQSMLSLHRSTVCRTVLVYYVLGAANSKLCLQFNIHTKYWTLCIDPVMFNVHFIVFCTLEYIFVRRTVDFCTYTYSTFYCIISIGDWLTS